MAPHAGRQLGTLGLLIELCDSVDNRQTGARGTLRVVVMRLGIAEERHHAVTEVLGDMATEAGYHFSSGAVVAAHRLAPFFGIELRRDRGGSNQVAEQHRQMAPLACDVARFSFRTTWHGGVQRSGALRTEPGFRRVVGPAPVAYQP